MKSRDHLKAVCLIAVINILCRFGAQLLNLKLEKIAPKHDHSIRVLKRQRAQQNGIDDTEDGGVRANAERERDDGGQSDCALSPQHAQAETQILKHLVLQSLWL